MIGALPMVALAPLDYRYALDAARTLFAPHATPLIRCNVAELDPEVSQRFAQASASIAYGVLWIEPLAASWRVELKDCADQLSTGSPLVVIASQPLARLVPERRTWGGAPLGMQLTGVNQLRRAMRDAGLSIESRHGIHSAASIALSQISHQAARLGRPEIGDRLHFAARLRYRAQGPLAALATVGLLVGRK
ncbi:MAG: hypothetical protein JOZ51_19790 [Chloroflexi bacterium]|nr:hypothetical protein [Chloroflexota bacterium]